MATITTTKGDLDESLLEKREGVSDGVAWVEYYLDGELVHRSAIAAMKGVSAESVVGGLNGDEG